MGEQGLRGSSGMCSRLPSHWTSCNWAISTSCLHRGTELACGWATVLSFVWLMGILIKALRLELQMHWLNYLLSPLLLKTFLNTSFFFKSSNIIVLSFSCIFEITGNSERKIQMHKCLSDFFCCFDKIPWWKGREDYFCTQVKGMVTLEETGLASWAWDVCAQCIHSQEAEINGYKTQAQ